MRRAIITIVSALAVTMLAVPGPAGATLAATGSGDGKSPVVAAAAPYLTAKWWQEFVAIPDANSLDRCDVGLGGVMFLAGTGGGDPVERTCKVSARRSLLVPLINAECSTVEGDGSTYLELRTCADGFASKFTGPFLTVDGVPVRHPERFRVRSGPFFFTSVDGNVFGIDPTKRSLSASDGYWATIGPLSRGRHTVSFGGEYPPGPFKTSVTYTLKVT